MSVSSCIYGILSWNNPSLQMNFQESHVYQLSILVVCMLVPWESWSCIENQVSKRIPRTNNCYNKQLDLYSQNLKWLRVSMKQFFLCVLNVDDLVILGHTRYFSTTQSYILHLHGTNVNDGWRVTCIDWHSNRKDCPLSSISLEARVYSDNWRCGGIV